MNAAGGKDGQEDLSIEYDIESLMEQYREPTVKGELSENLRRELNDVIHTLQHMATSDAIRSGRHWIEINCTTAEETKQVARAIRMSIEKLESPLHRLHLVYLVHDVVQNEVLTNKRANRGLSFSVLFKPFLVWIVRAAYQAAANLSDGTKEKVTRVLQLWADRGVIDADEKREMHALVTPPVLPALPTSQGSRGGSYNGGSEGTNQEDGGGAGGSTRKRRNRFDQGPPLERGSSTIPPSLPSPHSAHQQVAVSSYVASGSTPPSLSSPPQPLLSSIASHHSHFGFQPVSSHIPPAPVHSPLRQYPLAYQLQPPPPPYRFGTKPDGTDTKATAFSPGGIPSPTILPPPTAISAQVPTDKTTTSPLGSAVPPSVSSAGYPPQSGSSLPSCSLQPTTPLLHAPPFAPGLSNQSAYSQGLIASQSQPAPPPTPSPLASASGGSNALHLATSLYAQYASGDKLDSNAAMETPETVPVGVMATMMKQLSKRGKNMQTAFVPFRPLDPLLTPQSLPPFETPSEYLLDRVNDFYEDYKDETERLMREERQKELEQRRVARRGSQDRRPSRQGRYTRHGKYEGRYDEDSKYDGNQYNGYNGAKPRYSYASLSAKYDGILETPSDNRRQRSPSPGSSDGSGGSGDRRRRRRRVKGEDGPTGLVANDSGKPDSNGTTGGSSAVAKAEVTTAAKQDVTPVSGKDAGSATGNSATGEANVKIKEENQKGSNDSNRRGGRRSSAGSSGGGRRRSSTESSGSSAPSACGSDSERRGERRGRRRRSRSLNTRERRSRSSSFERRRAERQARRRRRDKARDAHAWEKPTAWAQAEMGVGDDGSVLDAPKGTGARMGVGAFTANQSDVFEKFRKQRSSQYHEVMALNRQFGVPKPKVADPLIRPADK